MNADEVQKQLENMRAFIVREAHEKADEIRCKAEAEFAIDKSRIVQSKREELRKEFEKKDKAAEMTRRIEHSNMLNAARLRALKARQDSVSQIKEDAAAQLVSISNDAARYRTFLLRTIAQALVKIEENTVVVLCRAKDAAVVKGVLPEAVALAAKSRPKAPAQTVTVDTTNPLKDSDYGGVILSTLDGRIMCDNTLTTRLDLAFDAMAPIVRDTLFGANPNRKHVDKYM